MFFLYKFLLLDISILSAFLVQRFHFDDSTAPNLLNDTEFMEELDQASRCKLPTRLKTYICKHIENHSFNCGLSLNLDLSAISSLPENVVKPFAELMQHASRVDYNAKQLVLKIIKSITEFEESDNDDESPHNDNPPGALTYPFFMSVSCILLL